MLTVREEWQFAWDEDCDIHHYYELKAIVMQKYQEGGIERVFKVAREFDYVLRDDRERKKDW